MISIIYFFDLNKSTLNYHLNYLEKTKQVISKREGRNRCYFGTEQAPFDNLYDHQAKINALTKIQKRILNTIWETPGISLKDICQRTKIKQRTIEYSINRLITLHLIWKVKDNNEIGYECITKETLRKEIYNRLLIKLLNDEIDEETFHKVRRTLESLDLEDLEDSQ